MEGAELSVTVGKSASRDTGVSTRPYVKISRPAKTKLKKPLRNSLKTLVGRK